MKKLRWPAISMIIAILAITGFQLYWLKNNYDREKQNLDIKTSASFRETILRLQASKLKLEKVSVTSADSGKASGVTVSAKSVRQTVAVKRPIKEKGPVITLLNLIQEKMMDSLKTGDTTKSVSIIMNNPVFQDFHLDTLKVNGRIRAAGGHAVNFSGPLDSLDPGLIREINVLKNGLPNDVVAIGYGRRPPEKIKIDSAQPKSELFVHKRLPADSQIPAPAKDKAGEPGKNAVFRFLYDVDSLYLKDSVTVQEVTNAFAARLKEEKINVPFEVNRLDSAQAAGSPNAVTIGFAKPATFGLSLQHTAGYMLAKLKLPILFSLLLVGLTIASFVLLYRNMIKQKRLADLKNEFISNITHELKTPIATVGVAIEALKNFNAIHDPARTSEYLDISQNELQRLNLLVDKVLKLSVFEKKAIELKKEVFDWKQLTEEIMNSMRLQFEKYHAHVSLDAEGEYFSIEADKLHITSVVYNLLDNALKYSYENPAIHVQLRCFPSYVELRVQDNGIGIPAEYRNKVFDKFFRVPTGNKHNIKGYGLGLSYVAEVVKHHRGVIEVDSEPGKGSTFIVRLPIDESSGKIS